MILRILTRLLDAALAEKDRHQREPTQYEIDSLSVAESSRTIARKSYHATLALGVLGLAIAVYFGVITVKLTRNQKNTSDALYRIELVKKYNLMNELAYNAADLEDEIGIYRDKMLGIKDTSITLLIDRVDKLKRVQNIMKQMYLVAELIPNKNIQTLWSDCISYTMQARLYYSQQVRRGYTVDTILQPGTSFDSLMFLVVEFSDSLMPHLDDGRRHVADEIIKFNKE